MNEIINLLSAKFSLPLDVVWKMWMQYTVMKGYFIAANFFLFFISSSIITYKIFKENIDDTIIKAMWAFSVVALSSLPFIIFYKIAIKIFTLIYFPEIATVKEILAK